MGQKESALNHVGYSGQAVMKFKLTEAPNWTPLVVMSSISTTFIVNHTSHSQRHKKRSNLEGPLPVPYNHLVEKSH